MRTYPKVFMNLLLFPCLVAGTAWADGSLDGLRKEADAVLKLGAVDARAKLGVVFEYARRAAEQGQLDEALKYYESGLRFHPLNFENQLAYAKLLAKAGRTELARRRAGIVAKSAEDDGLVAGAKKLLGERVSLGVEPISKPEGTGPVLVLVPMGEVDVLLLREAQERVKKTLGIEVLIRKAEIKLPPPRRTPFADFVGKLRGELTRMKTKSPEAFADLLKQEGFTQKALADDEKAIRLFLQLVRRGGSEGATSRFEATIRHVRDTEDQWDAGELVGALRKAVRRHERARARFVGVTRRDIFQKDYSFLLALRIGEHGVLSYRRYTADFTEEAPDRARLLRRLHVVCVNSAGHVFGLARCSDPSCPRSYSHSVAEDDKKGEELCPACKKAFRRAFGEGPEDKD